MVPSVRVLVNSHRLSIQTTLVSRTIWPEFAMQILTGVANPSWGNGWSYGVGDGSPDNSGPGTTSYRLSIVTIGLPSISHRLRSAPDVPDRQTDGRTKLV